MAAYSISFGCNFFGTKSYDMDRVDCGEDERGNNNKQKEQISWIWYLRRCECVYCNDSQCPDFTIHRRKIEIWDKKDISKPDD